MPAPEEPRKASAMPTRDDVMGWSEEQVSDFVGGLGKALASYTGTFADNGVDGAMFLQLSTEDLEDLGISSNLHKKKILTEIAKINSAGAAPTPTSAPAAAAAPAATFFVSPAQQADADGGEVAGGGREVFKVTH